MPHGEVVAACMGQACPAAPVCLGQVIVEVRHESAQVPRGLGCVGEQAQERPQAFGGHARGGVQGGKEVLYFAELVGGQGEEVCACVPQKTNELSLVCWGGVHFRGEGQAARGEEGADGIVHGGGAGGGYGGKGVVHEEAGAKASGGLNGVNDGESGRV